MKRTYHTPSVKMVKFKVERGFYDSLGSRSETFCGEFFGQELFGYEPTGHESYSGESNGHETFGGDGDTPIF